MITNVELNNRKIIEIFTDLMLICLPDKCDTIDVTLKAGLNTIKFHFDFDIVENEKLQEDENE